MNPSSQPPSLQETLQQLHDIQTPAEPGLWPPAPGWYLVALGVLLVLLWGGRKFFRWLRFRLWLRQSKRQLPDPVDTPYYFASVNATLKKALIQRFPQYDPWPLSGSEWVRFLCSRAPDMDERDLEALVLSGIQREPSLAATRADRVAREWLGRQR